MRRIEPTIPRSISPRKVVCGFTTRIGGVSHAPFNTLNTGLNTPDNRSNVLENRRIVYRHAGAVESNAALMGQVHGSVVRAVESGGVYKETDGLITGKAGILLGVLVADCIPLLLYDTEREVAGAIHCGWRSIAACIAVKAIGVMSERFSTASENVIAVLGPSAGLCCYEIKSDVAQHFNADSLQRRNGKIFADLKTELCGRLINAGILKQNIERFEDCTVCDESLYFSHRRDGIDSGRMMGYIMLKQL